MLSLKISQPLFARSQTYSLSKLCACLIVMAQHLMNPVETNVGANAGQIFVTSLLLLTDTDDFLEQLNCSVKLSFAIEAHRLGEEYGRPLTRVAQQDGNSIEGKMRKGLD